MRENNSWKLDISAFTSYRQNLPHLEDPGAWYFTTSITHARSNLSNQERDLVLAAIRFHDGIKYELRAAVVMPDHFHLIMVPLTKEDGSYFGLREIFHSIKSYTAKVILTSRGPTAARTVWQKENFDHIIRNEKDYLEKLNYLIYNPVVDGIVEKPEEYRWLWYEGIRSLTA